jgi:hypothetical protein
VCVCGCGGGGEWVGGLEAGVCKCLLEDVYLYCFNLQAIITKEDKRE